MNPNRMDANYLSKLAGLFGVSSCQKGLVYRLLSSLRVPLISARRKKPSLHVPRKWFPQIALMRNVRSAWPLKLFNPVAIPSRSSSIREGQIIG